MKKKTIIIIAVIVVVIAIVTTILISKSRKKKKELEEWKKQYDEAMSNPNVSTVVNEEGQTVPKEQATSLEGVKTDLRQNDAYKNFYGNAQCVAKATAIKDAYGTWNDCEQCVYDALSGLNKYTYLALADYMCNELQICSIHLYLKKFLDLDEYNIALTKINDARKRG